MDLSGARGARLWQISQQAAQLLAERESLLAELRSAARPSPAPGPAPAPPPGPAPGPPPGPPPIPIARPPSLVSRIGVQGLLVALGALLVAVAGIVFLVFAWDRLSLGGRALVVGALTLAAMAGATRLRPRLPETAEGIGAIATVLVLGDAWAIRATGLFGTDGWNGVGYAALATAACAAVLVAWARIGGVRAGSLVAVMLAPFSVVLAGSWIVSRGGEDLTSVAGLGLVGAAALGAARVSTPVPWRAERAILRWSGVVYWVVALLLLPVWTLAGPGLGTLVLLGASATAVLQIWADQRRLTVPGTDAAPAGGHQWWSLGAGVALALAAVPAGVRLIRWLDVTAEPLLAVVPVTSAVIALLASRTSGPGRAVHLLSHRWAVRGARGVAVVAAVPAVAVVLAVLLAVVEASSDLWQSGAGTALRDALPALSDVLDADDVARVHGYAVAGLLGTGAVLGLSRPFRWAAPAAGLVAAGLVVAPFVPALPVVAVLITLLLIAVLAGLLARRVRLRPPTWLPAGPWRAALVARTALGLAIAAGATAVLLSWTVRALCVPVTVVAAVALIGLREVLPARNRPALAAFSVLAATLAVAALSAVLELPDTAGARVDLFDVGGPAWLDPRVAGITAALLGAVLAGLPAPDRWREITAERASGAVTGMALAAVPVLALLAGEGVAWGAAGALMVGAAFLLVAAVAAFHPASAGSPAGARPALLGAGLAPVAVVVTAIAPQLAEPDPNGRTIRIVAAAAIAVCGLAIGVLGAFVGNRSGLDRRIPAAELGTLVPLVLVALPVVGGPLADYADLGSTAWSDRQAWIAPLLLGVAATALAMAPARRRLAWLGWLLLSASNAFRLLAGGVDPGDAVEAYTLPPALALLAVSAVRLRLDREGTPRSTLLPGLSLAVLPSILAAPTGPWQRPALLIALGALALAASRLVDRRLRWAVAVGATSAAGGAVLARAGHALVTETEPGWRQLEAWALPGAAVVLAAGVLWLRSDTQVRSWGPLGPGVALLLGPSLLAVLDGEPVWRVAALAVLAGAVVAAGSVARLQAPVVLGAVVLALHAVVQLGPWVARVIAGQPRWLALAVVGAALLALGATYERRLRQLRAIRLRVSGLR